MPKFPELDGLRGLLALWVFAGHFLLFVGQQDGGHLELLGNGQIPVTVFMILSGFVITGSLDREARPYGDYLKRRALRIYPAYLLSLALAGVAALAGGRWPFVSPSTAAQWAARADSERLHAGAHVAAHLALVHGLIPDAWLAGTAQALNGPAWSLSLEWQFYLFAPVILAVVAAPFRRIAGVGVLAVVCVLGAMPPVARMYPFVPSFLPMQLGYFLVGMLTALHLRRLREGGGLAIAAVLSAVVATGLLKGLAFALPLAIWAGTVALMVAKAQGPLRGLLRLPALQAFGRRSYGFYLFHMPILTIVSAAFVASGAPVRADVYAVALVTALPLTDLLAWVSWRRLERPAIAWGARRARPGGSPASPVAFAQSVSSSS